MIMELFLFAKTLFKLFSGRYETYEKTTVADFALCTAICSFAQHNLKKNDFYLGGGNLSCNCFCIQCD